MTIRPMTHNDIADGLRLCRASNWNQLDDDWHFFLDHGGARLAVDDGDKVVGSVAWLPFGDDFAWLSMMLVDPAVRRGGIGSRLMEAALAELEGRTVRLDATPAGEPMYRKFGFVTEYPLGRCVVSEGRPAQGFRPMTTDDLPAIFARDREVFGADRSGLLADLYRRAPEYAWIGRDAYCFGRPGHIHPQIGPVVASDFETAEDLVDHVVHIHGGREFFIDPTQMKGGLIYPVVRPFLRMCLGGVRQFGDLHRQYAITGPEFG
jgi:GNAT superfamily N-acetyltransferase